MFLESLEMTTDIWRSYVVFKFINAAKKNCPIFLKNQFFLFIYFFGIFYFKWAKKNLENFFKIDLPWLQAPKKIHLKKELQIHFLTLIYFREKDSHKESYCGFSKTQQAFVAWIKIIVRAKNLLYFETKFKKNIAAKLNNSEIKLNSASRPFQALKLE